MRIYTKKDILHTSLVYKIPLSIKQAEDFVDRLKKTFGYLESFKKKKKLIANLQPLNHPSGLINALREDRIQKSLRKSMVFSNTKNFYKGYFVCPGIFHEN